MLEIDLEKFTSKNHMFGAFPSASRNKLLPHLKLVEPKLGATVCEAGSQLKYAYFPEASVLSLLTVMEDGSEIESATIGCEGVFGIFSALYNQRSFSRCVVQYEGRMLRCRIGILQDIFHNNMEMQNILLAYSESILSQVMQSVACIGLHSIRERLCRLLLTADDRIKGKVLTYTHELLSRVMSVNRTSVTLAAQSLQDRGLISYRRGMITIQDRKGLEASCCECYAVLQARFIAPPELLPLKT